LRLQWGEAAAKNDSAGNLRLFSPVSALLPSKHFPSLFYFL